MDRKEAIEKLLGECRIIMYYSWSEDRQKVDVPHEHLSDSKTIKLINEIYDGFENKKKNCGWIENCEYDGGIVYLTRCKNEWVTVDAQNPIKTGMVYCPFCGGKIKIKGEKEDV